jgi:hypothetical protein
LEANTHTYLFGSRIPETKIEISDPYLLAMPQWDFIFLLYILLESVIKKDGSHAQECWWQYF